jgi:ribose transport system substrate-binding protein
MTGRWKLVLVAVMVVALGLGVAACGGSSSSSSSSSSTSAESSGEESSGASSSLTAFDEKMENLVTEEESPSTSRPPTTGPKAQTGKKVAIIPCAEEAEGCKRIADAAEAAAKTIGWEVIRLDGGGTPDKEGAAIRQAITAGADAMTLVAIDGSLIQGPLKEAQKAGVKLVGVAADNPGGLYEGMLYPASDNTQGGYVVGAALYDATEHELNLVSLEDNSVEATRKRNEGMKKFLSECQAAGGSCNVVGEGSFTVPDLTTRLPQLAVNAAQQSPDANAVWVSHDAGMSFVVPALESADLGNLIGGATDGNGPNLEFIRKGEIQQFDWSYPLEWTGYATIDQLNRLLAGEKLEGEAATQGMEPRLITPKNVPKSGPYNGLNVVPLYEKVWGK